MAAADRHDDSKRGVCGRGADGRTAPARDRRAWRQAQADRRAAGHQPSCGYGVASTDRQGAKEVLGVERIAVVADRGYFKIEDIEACEKARD